MRRRRLEALYGIWPSLLAEKLREQDWECAICHRDFRMMRARERHIDHDHRSGKVRGILCHHCNIMLGLGFDDPEIFEAAVRYLKKYECLLPTSGHPTREPEL